MEKVKARSLKCQARSEATGFPVKQENDGIRINGVPE